MKTGNGKTKDKSKKTKVKNKQDKRLKYKDKSEVLTNWNLLSFSFYPLS